MHHRAPVMSRMRFRYLWLFFILTTSLVFITASLGRTSVASARDTTDPSGSSVQALANQPITPAQITEGYRPYIEWHANGVTAEIPRQSTFKAFVRAGEQIFIGSSAMNRAPSGDVIIRAPNGSTPDTCNARATGNELYGRIVNRAQEVVGALPATGGYQPCIITPAETTATGDGIWEFDFISPSPTANLDTNPAPIRITEEWANTDLANHWIAAWDISVRDGTNAAIERTGRVFANYLALNMGSNASLFGAPDDIGLYKQFYILTVDGQGYEVDLNGIDPFGFIFFANAKGIVDNEGESIYRSLQLTGANLAQPPPPGYGFHKPEDPDNLAQRNVTHKIFFDLTGPDPDMPATARTPDGETWLLRGSQTLAPLPQNLTFVGEEGTPGQAGTNPLGGTFSFDAPADVTYEIVIDTNRNNRFDDPEDRILSGLTTAPRTSVFWDGLDQLGERVEAGSVPFRAQARLSSGEIHFPFIDAESNPNGMIIERVRPTPQPDDPDPFTIYYNDVYNYTGTGDYDFSPCALVGDTPPPPASAGISDPTCYGRSLSPLERNALGGVSSAAGAHAWDSSAEPQFGFGDRRIIDTWTFFPSAFVQLVGGVVLAEADLSIAKSHEPAVLYSGGPITYTVTVRNPGPSPSLGTPVRDEVPPEITNVSWTCALIAGTGACGQASGSGNVLSTTVDLQPNSAISFTLRGTIDPAFTGTLTNTAIITRTADTTDPDLENNRATDVIQVNAPADLSLSKVVNNTRPNVGEVITYTITLTNAGPSNATGVTVSEPLTTELTFVSATTSVGTYDPATGIWDVGSIAANTTETLTIAARINAYNPTITNIAQVQTADQPDPNSTPGNNIPGEDDQSSQVVRPPVADLELAKTVSAPRVNVGDSATFTITLFNRGPDPATGVTVREELPAGLEFVRANPSRGSYSNTTSIWTIGNLAVSETVTLALDVIVRATGPQTNTAQVDTSDQHDPDSTPGNNIPTEDDQDSATINGDEADLSLSKVVNNTRPNVGEVITYTITLTNAGPSDATGVTVSEPLTTELTFVRATASVGTYDPVTGIWDVGSIAANTTETLTIAARINAYSPTITNIAQVQESDQPDPDSTPGNNIPGEDDQSSQVVRPPVADLELAKTVSAPRVNVGDSATFTITLFNRGPDPATGVTVREELPAGLEFVRANPSRGSYSNTTSIWTIGNLAVSETVTLALDVIVRATGTQTNTAEVDTSDQHDPDSTPGNNDPNEDDQDSATITGDEADLSLSKVVNTTRPNVGDVITYTITLTNAGPSTATGVTVSEPLAPELTFVRATASVGTYDDGSGIWTVGTIAANTTETLTIAARIDRYSPTITNTAQVQTSDQPDPDSTPGNNNPGEDDQSSQVVRPLVIDLELAHSVAILNGEERTARLVIDLLNREQCNAEPCTTATQVQVQHRIPQDLLRYVTYSTGQGTYSYEPATGIGTWDVGTLPAGGAVQIFVDVEITAGDAEEIVSVAEVWRAIEFDIDSTPANNILAEDDQEEVRFSFLTPITLKSFTAARTSAGVEVAWETGMELDTRGFNLWRSSDGTRAGAVLITPQMIASRGSSTGGAAYQFVDTTATTDNAYAYWLVEIANNGLTSDYGPVRVARDPSNLTREHSVFLPLIVRR
ncbi:DUF11 domain-containing protein [Candidatus Chloroploca sp. M-50]|uniref:DUF11 domain-containing protein n=1 Tax=Candidatus Chloroploca mongolica TaxID=2528176 RepID=A0ABS4DH35_9CHLR|nr:DUF11 domain-containing protein [Candidatus Chloroploca mongolica]MBP1468737.1 DUF11 domain-containing protein [Candidatus Chloroploca mongolica]